MTTPNATTAPAQELRLPKLDKARKLVPFSLYFRCTENDVENEHDGGKVLFQAIGHQDIDGLTGCNFVLQFAVDGDRATETGMFAFPMPRPEKAGIFYKVTLEELDESPIPPPPVQELPPAFQPELVEENARLRAELEALRASSATQEGVADPVNG